MSAEAKRILKAQLDLLIHCLHEHYPADVPLMHKAERIGNILMLLSPIFVSSPAPNPACPAQDTATNFVESHHQVQFFDIWQLDSLMLQFLKNKV